MKKVVSLMLVLMLSMLLMPMAWAEACEHPEGYQSDASEWIDWKAGIVDSKTHEIVGTYIGQNHCSLCDTVYDTGVVRYGSSFIENHIWENNVCVDCGYRNTCSHPYDQKSTYTYVSGSVTNTTSTTHTITGEKYEETYCSACDTILSSKVVSRNASGTENHTFNDKGKCAVCDYVNTCNHRNIDVDTGYYWYETEQVNENAHREYGELVEEYFCKDCQTIYQTNVLDENFSILQDHTYEGNKCTACGYISKCQHPSQYLATMTVHHFVSSRNIDEKTFIDTCNMVYVNEIIKDNILSYDYNLEENGANISGGQRQRIILARSLMKDSRIILIDEGLNEIDINLERKILKNIFSYYKDKTIIIISHRLENMDLYDKVINIENGLIKDVLIKNE